ncbi:hypothetical protein [Moraxella cuniculi]|uniref:Uncharacterized protein n=1 Tax=Moraxella cuniculi TaxID=34061 RepID=A0A3S4QQK8_9GAMM|nr:hypothetical protein [Moraxella cuniculi]VEG13738.1 Uncharacterised protein [Moraxella cuniculi]
MSLDYVYTNIVNFKRITIGRNLRSYSRYWGLFDHEGVIVDLSYLGPYKRKKCYLPFGLLKKLYENFDSFHNYNCLILEENMCSIMETRFFSEEYCDENYENKLGFFSIDHTDDEMGYPFLLPFLPELNDHSIIQSLSIDPLLDVELFYNFVNKNQLILKDFKFRHIRWSQEWFNYCYRITKTNTEFQIFDDSNFV